jgi:hypothetical protein
MERKSDDVGIFTWFNQIKAPLAGGISGFFTRALTQPLDCNILRPFRHS